MTIACLGWTCHFYSYSALRCSTTAENLRRKPSLAALFVSRRLPPCGGGDYIISTKTGTMIEATSKPYLDEATGMYMYRSRDGRRSRSAKKRWCRSARR